MPDTDLILRVADAIEAAALPGARPEIGFNMGDWSSETLPDQTGHRCGTTACIAGWAVLVEDGFLPRMEDIEDRARVLLSLSDAAAEDLFSGSLGRIATAPSHAVTVLRHLARTGEVDWTVAGDL